MTSPFKEKYKLSLLSLIDTLPLVHVDSRKAQYILKYHAVDIIRRREAKEVTFPYKFKKAVFQLLP